MSPKQITLLALAACLLLLVWLSYTLGLIAMRQTFREEGDLHRASRLRTDATQQMLNKLSERSDL